MSDLEWASKSIDDLQSIVQRLRGEAPRKNFQSNAADGFNQISPDRIKVEAVEPARAAIDAILDALKAPRGGIHSRIPGEPPEWWRDFKKSLREEGLEHTASLEALRDAVAILDPYIREDTSSLAGLAFLTEDMNGYLHLRSGGGFRAYNNPNPNQLGLVFEPEVDDQIRDAFDKLNREIGLFPQGCISFLTDALNEARDVIG